MHTLQKKLPTLLISLACLMLSAQQVIAQGVSAIDLAISPPTTYVQVEPGQKKSITITLEQKGEQRLEITPSLVDFSSDNKTGQPVLATSSSFKYLRLSLPKNDTSNESNPSSFILEPGAPKKVQAVIDIPSNATEGEFPLTLLFRARPTTDAYQLGSGSQVSAVVGSNIIILISPTDRDRSNLVLEKITTYTIVDSFMPISFSLTAKNSGKNATIASGSAQITNWQGSTLTTFPIYPDMVLAQSSRELRTTADISSSLEDPSLISDTFSYKPFFAFGPYTITASLEKQSQELTATSTVTQNVFALPFSLVAIGLISIAVWIIFSYLRTKNNF